MPRLGPREAQIIVLTAKEGLLSRVAHDLQLRATAFHIDHDPTSGRIEAHIDASSLRVEHAMKNGRPSPGTLSADERATIDRTIRDDVLHSDRHREIRFEGALAPTSPGRSSLHGKLFLNGATRPITLRLERAPAGMEAECRLDQRTWGIEPYRAMMGTLKVQPEVVVRITVPWSEP